MAFSEVETLQIQRVVSHGDGVGLCHRFFFDCPWKVGVTIYRDTPGGICLKNVKGGIFGSPIGVSSAMPTVLGHAMVGIGLGAFAVSREQPIPQKVSTVASLAILSATPDLDALAFAFGIPYGHAFGHRGFFHSAVFALILGVFFFGVAYLDMRSSRRPIAAEEPAGKTGKKLILVYLIVAVSHPLLDMLTDGGLGIALLAPFSNERLFFPWTPIPVSPIGLSASVLPVLGWELMVFGPILIWICMVGWLARRFLRKTH